MSIRTKHPVFDWEEDLQASFLESASHDLWAPQREYDGEYVFEECSWSDGRADAVWAGIRGEVYECEVVSAALANPPVSRIVAALAPRTPRSERRLFDACGVAPATFRSALTQAIEAELAEETQSGRFILGAAVPSSEVELCAFEFKLRDWRRALYQALRYRSFSHRVYIVRPTGRVNRALEESHRFRQFGVGLIEHCTDGSSKRRILARHQRPRSRPSFVRALGDLYDPG